MVHKLSFNKNVNFIYKIQILRMLERLSSLPKRDKNKEYFKNCMKENLKTNLYKVQFDQAGCVSIFSIKEEPPIPDLDKQNLFLQSIQKQISARIGCCLRFGKQVYSTYKAKSANQSFKIQSNFRHQKFTVNFKLVKTINFSDINGKGTNKFIPINFFNVLIKNFLKNLKFVQVGKTGKYLNPKLPRMLNSAGIILFNGYQTSFKLAQNGLYLQIDSMTRIIQTRTVLEQINKIYARNSHLNKQQKRNVLKEQLTGKTVLSNYGNSRVWLIKQVVFDFDIQNTKIGPESNLTFVQYYSNTYGLTITNKKQPVLKAVLNGTRRVKMQKQSILIPQFLLMSGLPEDFDERKRRQISEYTIIQPQEKMKKIQELVNAFNCESQNFCPNSVQKNLGIKISFEAQKVESVLLHPPILQLGKGDSIEKNKVANFQLFNKQIFRHQIPVNIVIILPGDFDFSPIQKLFVSTCKNLCLKHSLNILKINYQDTKKAMIQIQKIIEDKQNKLKNYDLNWFILPPNMKSQYKTIKIMSLKKQNPKVTQIAITTTLMKKGFASVLTKVLIQISTKVGNTPWAPKIPSSINPKTILIGIDTAKGSKKNNIIAFCCTLDKQMTKFHSNYHYQVINSNLSIKMGEIVSECLTYYSKSNNTFPQQIIVIKKDLSDGQKDHIVQTQIDQIRNKFKDMNGYSPKLTFITANKHSKQKFFLENRTVSNPSYGTLINSKIVSNFYDFYLIAQHCNRGTVKPIHYKVLYTDSKMAQGVLQELIYVQSFNYMNWSGSVRVPSVLQYATKLCLFVNDHIGANLQTEQLNNMLYYI